MNKKTRTPLLASGIPIFNTDIYSLGVAIANIVWVVFTVIAVISFVVAGILFLTAQGDPGKITTARQAVIWGVGGVVVAILGFAIISIIGGVL
ncbi:MAG: hypothetical protein ABIJ84_01660 [bacterium]